MKPQIPFLEELRTELMEAAASGSRSVTAPERRIGGPVVAMAAFVAVLLVGIAIWAIREGPAPDVAEAPELIDWDLRVGLPPPVDIASLIAAVEAIRGVVQVQYIPDSSVLYPEAADDGEMPTTTRSPDPEAPPTAPAPIRAALFVTIDDPADAPAIAERLESVTGGSVDMAPDVAMVLEGDHMDLLAESAEPMGGDPLLLRPASGPEPLFDPTPLGREVPLLAPASIDDLLERIGRHSGVEGSLQWDTEAPTFVIGRVEGIDGDLVLFRTLDHGYCSFLFTISASGGGCGGITGTHFGLAGAGSPPGHVAVTVPLETAVVVVTGEGEEPMWQRPVGGWGLFPMRIYDYRDVVVDGYDSSGNLIGHWEDSL